jgi:hypothetical protein
MHCGNGSSFDHLVGAPEQRKRYGQTERLGAFQIQKQLYFRGSLHRQVARLLTLENPADV